MNLTPTPIAGSYTVSTQRQQDARGSFARLFCQQAMADALGGQTIAQINHSTSAAKGTIRGMHFQHAPHAETKLVRCLNGRVWDVLVDLRHGSPTFLQWHAVELSAANDIMLVIPPGCAHGFQTLEDDCELLYMHTRPYVHDAEGGVLWNDPRLAIAWPLPVTELSERDRAHPLLTADFQGVAP